MILTHTDLWSSTADLILVTSNSTTTRDNRLVMGAGAALQARTRYPGCDRIFGQLVTEHRRLGRLWDIHPGTREPYVVILHPEIHAPDFGIFQVKWHWAQDANLDVIAYSSEYLRRYALTRWPGVRIALNFPGTGNGYLPRASILPIITRLPDNVEVHEL